MSEDPIGFAGGDTNLYRYAFNSPDNATDPSGNIIFTSLAIGALAAFNYFVWKNNAAVADDIVNGREINRDETIYSGEWWKGAATYTATGAAIGAGGAWGVTRLLAAGASKTGLGVIGAGLGAYGAYTEGSTAIHHFRQGNYFQGVFHTFTAGTSAFGGYRSSAPARAATANFVRAHPRLNPANYSVNVDKSYLNSVGSLKGLKIRYNGPNRGVFPTRPGGTGAAYDEVAGQGIYVLRDSSGNIRYAGRGDAPQRLLAHAKPGSGKEDLVGEVLFNNNLPAGKAKSLEQELMQMLGGPKSVNPSTSLRNNIQGIGEGNPNFIDLEFEADDDLVIEALRRAGLLGR